MTGNHGGVRWGILAAVAVGLMLPLAGTASAQFVTNPKEKEKEKAAMSKPTAPRPRKADDPPVLWMVAIGGILLLGIGTAALIPSKRGHQD